MKLSTLLTLETELATTVKAAIAKESEKITDYLKDRLTCEDAWDKDELFEASFLGVEKVEIDWLETESFDSDDVVIDYYTDDYCEGHVTVRVNAEGIEGSAELAFEDYYDGDEVYDARQLYGNDYKDIPRYAKLLKFIKEENDYPDHEECTIATVDSYDFEVNVSFACSEDGISIEDIEFEEYETERNCY